MLISVEFQNWRINNKKLNIVILGMAKYRWYIDILGTMEFSKDLKPWMSKSYDKLRKVVLKHNIQKRKLLSLISVIMSYIRDLLYIIHKINSCHPLQSKKINSLSTLLIQVEIVVWTYWSCFKSVCKVSHIFIHLKHVHVPLTFHSANNLSKS